ncbi:MAG: radical SAM protein [Candidatus Krumholzibacteriota bacterium]|nr:radical SAM protein [Candidatus Krumholzibacteriota bacterium]
MACRVRQAAAALADCRLCPRACGADRASGGTGFCRTGRDARVASAGPHLGEEDVLRGWRGSGTIFFARCNLACVFCQNHDISQGESGQPLAAVVLADIMLTLQDRGCHNVNLVSPSHVVAQVLAAVDLAAGRGLALPLVYNTNAYDALETLRLLDGVVDVYMPDFKFWDPAAAERCVGARDYPERARAAIAEMHRQVGVLRVDGEGLARRGVLLRHLVMPGGEADTAAVLGWVAAALSPDTALNLMGQYRPAHRVGTPDGAGGRRFAELDRPPSASEMASARAAAAAAGLWRFV